MADDVNELPAMSVRTEAKRSFPVSQSLDEYLLN